MALSAYASFAYRWLRPLAVRVAARTPDLGQDLQRAHITQRADVFLSYVLLNALLAAASVTVLILLLAAFVGFGAIGLPGSTFLLLLPLPILVAGTSLVIAIIIPRMRASSRARDIDAKLPFMLDYVATMSSAGITLERTMEGLSRQKIYGEIAKEAGWIVRDLRLLGQDIVTALTLAARRTPSKRFQDLLQGTVVTITAGGNLKTFFLGKSEQYAFENRLNQTKFLETLGVMAESFVTVVVAAPLLLIVLLSSLTVFGGSGGGMLRIGWIIILVVLPLAQMGFGFAMKGMTPEQ